MIRLKLVLFDSAFASMAKKIEVDKDFPVVPQLGSTIEHHAKFYQVQKVIFLTVGPPILVGTPTDNPFK